jgi:hypothetical protein
MNIQKSLYAVLVFTSVLLSISILLVAAFAQTESDHTTGTHMFSAMSLFANATGNHNDTDLEEIVKYVISDMGGMFGFHEIKHVNGVDRLDIVLLYHPKYDSDERVQYNRDISQMLPSRLSEVKQQDFFASGDSTEVSSCLCSWDNVYILQILYNAHNVMQRVSVVAHEYYHVQQTHYCRRSHTEKYDAPMWMSEGTATVFQHLYLQYYFKNHPRHENFLFNSEYGAIKTLHDMATRSEDRFVYDDRMNTYERKQNNYVASSIAVLWLIQKLYESGVSDALYDVLVKYMMDGRCSRASTVNVQTAFEQSFPTLGPYELFFSNLNDYLLKENTTTVIAYLQLPYPAVLRLFNHTTICSDMSPSSRDGVCDPNQAMTDCSDCGPSPRPEFWPVTLGPEEERS